MTTVSLRALNRTWLDRQFLAEPTAASPLEVIQHLVAMQSQDPNWPYVGLWARLASFDKSELFQLFADHQVVRSTMLRRTIHLACAEDFAWVRPTLQPAVRRLANAAYYAGWDPGPVAATSASPPPKHGPGARWARRTRRS
jgi:hypothetical protein